LAATAAGLYLGLVLHCHERDCTLAPMKIPFGLRASIPILPLLFSVSMAIAAEPTPSIPRRIISMAPNLTEIVYDIGAQDLLVGVTDFCKFPPAARSKEKVGGWIDPNYEKIISLKPDLVLALKFHGKAVDNLKTLKVPVLVLDCQT